MQGFSPKEGVSATAPSRPEASAQIALPLLIRRNRPARRTADTRRRQSGRFVQRGEPQPEAHASRSRPIRPTIAAKSGRGTDTSASWNTRYLACDTTLAPILTYFSRSVVSVQPWMGLGSTRCRRHATRHLYNTPQLSTLLAAETLALLLSPQVLFVLYSHFSCASSPGFYSPT